MIDPGAVLTDGQARHLLRRTGFGASPKEFLAVQGKTRGAAADQLLGFKPKAFRPNGRDLQSAHDKWLKYMITTKTPLQEKLVLFWHDHFSVAIAKVGDVKRMGNYIGLIHLNASGDFRAFVKAMSKNAAMMEFLDTVRNKKDAPNENYARELMELFTLGVKDFTPSAANNYTQEDVVQIARGFSGWDYDRNDRAFLDPNEHDDGTGKIIFQSTGQFGAGGVDYTDQGTGPGEIDRIVDIILQHRDTQGNVTVARRIAYRLCEFFAHPNPSLTFVDEIVADSNFDTTWDIKALCRSLFASDDFYLTASGPPYVSTSKKSVRWPVDYMITTLRLVGVKPVGRFYQIPGDFFRSLFDHLTGMGQTLMDPPSVFGWDWETSWISSATLLARAAFADDVISARRKFKPEKLVDIGLSVPADIVDAVTDVLGVTDQITSQERQAFIDYLTDDGAVSSLDLHDYDTRNRKLHGLFALVLESPAYQLQ